jgi:prepilin-type N-terminal cleavage/methylation domain-containing protein/prepilin-type processing-associated H-X9-DG protein
MEMKEMTKLRKTIEALGRFHVRLYAVKLERRMPTEDRKAFTLIELLVVIALIATLAAFAVTALSSIQERARITQDMNNLRQIALATQTYLNDNDGGFFLPTGGSSPWMNSLHPKYLSNWKIFQSPFDKRAPSENNTTAPVSYGFNLNAQSSGTSLLSDKITNPSVFILFAPAQGTLTTVSFTGTAAASVTVDKAGGSQGTALGGTHNNRRRINACMADLHVENMLRSVFINNTNSSTDPSASQRWTP